MKLTSIFRYQTFIDPSDSNLEILFTSAISVDAINGNYLIKDKNNRIDTNAND